MKKVVSFICVVAMSIMMLFPLLQLEAKAEGYYLWPVPYTTTLSRGYSSGHTGLDISSGGITGQNVVATKSGTVYYVYSGCNNNNAAGTKTWCSSSTCNPNAGITSLSKYGYQCCNWGYGNGVVIQHSDGSGYSMYAHMKTVAVSKGQSVNQGQVIGTVGSTGNSTGAHLHYELSSGGSMSGTYFRPSGSINNNKDAINYSYDGQGGSGNTDDAIVINTIGSSNITETTAHIEANVYVNRRCYEVGAEYSTNSDMSNSGVVYDSNYPTIRDRIWYDFGNGTYPALSKGTQYYYRFYYIENPGEGKHYSETKSFTTSGSSQVTSEYLTYDNVGIVSVEDTSAIVVAEVSTNGDVIKYVAGHGISSDSISWVGIYETSLHRLTWKFDDLQPSTTYYYQYDVFTASGKDYKSNIYTFTTAAAPDAQGPVISDVIINNTSSDGFDVSCRATDNVAMDRVSFAVWSDNETNAQWITGNRNGDTYSCRALTSDHNDYTGHYNIHIYAYDTSGNESMTATAGVDVPARVVEPAMTFNSVSSSSISQNTAHIEANVSINRSCYEVGAEYSTSPDMRNASTINDSGYPGIVDRIYYDFGNGIYPALTSGTTYYYRFYFKEKSDDSRHYSNVFSFTTQKENVDPVDPIEPVEPVDESGVAMYRLYNINSGEHFYTANASEMNNLSRLGWSYEGVGWTAPAKSSIPVYRLYNPNAGDHHYTTNISERNTLISIGWNDEGIGWYSAEKNGVPLYREYNPNAMTGTHNYTTSTSEHYNLVSLGWRDEGIGWYGLAGGNVETQSVRLVDLEPIKHNKYIFYIGDEEAPERLLTDLEGNKYRYDEVMYCDDWLGNENQTEVEYFLNKQYENFTGVLYFPLSAKAFYKRDGGAAQEFRPRFDVYCDDILVYTSPEINDINAGPYSFEINAKDARVLKIKMGGYWNGTGTRNVDFGATLCAANMRLR